MYSRILFSYLLECLIDSGKKEESQNFSQVAFDFTKANAPLLCKKILAMQVVDDVYYFELLFLIMRSYKGEVEEGDEVPRGIMYVLYGWPQT